MTDLSLKLYRDQILDDQFVFGSLLIPVIDSTNLPAALIPDGIAYDKITDKIWYCNGLIWQPIGGGSGGNSVDSYGFYLNNDISIPPSTTTILSGWTILPSPPYSNLSGSSNWDLLSGVYTATSAVKLTVDVCISWEAGSNLGTRTLMIMYNGSPIAVTETQAVPDDSIDTPQSLSFDLSLVTADEVWVAVSHNAPAAISIVSGASTILSGLQISAS